MLNRNMSLADGLRVAEQFGCLIERKRRTGELRVSHPTLSGKGSHVVLNSRKKDVPRRLLTLLRKVAPK